MAETDETLERTLRMLRDVSYVVSCSALAFDRPDLGPDARALALSLDELSDALEGAPPDPAWAEFVGGHPELTEFPPFTDADVLRALRRAIPARKRLNMRSTYACDVARHVFGEHLSNNQPRDRPAVAAVAQRLRRLTAAGKVVRLRPSCGGGACRWSLPGVELTPRDLDGRRVEYA